MQRSAILSVTLLSAVGLIFAACTQDFNQFEPTGGAGGATGGSGGTTSSSTTAAGGSGGAGGATSSSSTASSSTAASSSSTGGMSCNNDNQCPTDTACRNHGCMMGMCGFTDVPNGNAAPNGFQTGGDCQEVRCDGMGNETMVADNGDTPPNDGNICTQESCSNGVPTSTNRPAGYNCNNGNVCDGNGKCVECVDNGDCNMVAGERCDTATNTCISCSDGKMNGDETGIDCGGASCKKCDGTACAMAAECGSNNCVDTVCCDTACTGTCQSCNVTGKEGTCSNLPLNAEDTSAAMTCVAPKACNGMGACLLKNGETCVNANECLSGNCMSVMGNKSCQP